jgi:hypothetical protein
MNINIDTIKNTIKNIEKSVIINYKSWIILIISIYFIAYNDLINGIVTFIFMLIASHSFHYSCHLHPASVCLVDLFAC